MRTLDDIFAFQADWTTLLTCIDMRVSDAELWRVDGNSNLSRLQSVLEHFQLMPISNPHYSVHQFTLLAMLYMSPRQVPATKMPEALCLSSMPTR